MTARVLAALLLVIALVAGGYRWGAHATDNAWQAKEAQRLQAEADARESQMRRAEKASGALQAELQQQAITNDELTKAFNDYKKRNPILARRVADVAPAAGAAAAPASGDAAPAAQRQGGAVGPDPGITLGAVWMWNSALSGRDTPAGACGLADTSEGACAADSGVSLEDAWDNQALNARLCADDRLRHQRLIDFLKENNK
jgi:hypothetical protein